MADAANALDRLQMARAALEITEETDRVLGIERRGARDNLTVMAARASKELRPHPLDPHIAAVRSRYLACYRPKPGQWWTDRDRVSEGRAWRAVLAGLLLVRIGERPTAATALIRRHASLESHQLDGAELKVYHYCRLAGLLELEQEYR